MVVSGFSTLAAAALNQTGRNQLSKKSKPLPNAGEFVRLIDPTTESMVVRLTNPAYASYLPQPGNRFVSTRQRFLLFSSDRTGHLTPFSVDLRTGVPQAVAVTTDLLPSSLCLDAQGRSAYFIDAGDLKQIAIGNKKATVLARGVSAFSVGTGPSGIVVVRDGHLEQLSSGAALATGIAPWCALRPGGRGCAFTRHADIPQEQEFWYAPIPAASPVLLAKGRISNPIWSPDGSSLLFLRDVPVNDTFVSEIHAAYPDVATEQRITPTSQFASFAPNGDASVFVGASKSKAQPTVILLLRSPQRELTLCEHKAAHPNAVDPVFSPDSRRVYYQSDHEGKSALYSVNTESLVEPTPPSEL